MDNSTELPLERIKSGSVVIRSLDEDVITNLARSILTNGLLQPILVRPCGSKYEVVFGHHRLEACRRLGLKSIRAMVRDLTSEECFLTQVVENLQRNVAINPLSEAEGYIRLINAGWSINRIAVRIGKSDSYVSDRIGLIRRLHPTVAQKFYANRNGHLTPSHLELLARVTPKGQQLTLSDLVERKHLSVRNLERLVSKCEPHKSTVEERDGSLVVKLPNEIVERINVEVGESVYIFSNSRKRIIIEPVRCSRMSQPEPFPLPRGAIRLRQSRTVP